MKKRQTVEKYKNYAAPKGAISNMLDHEDLERTDHEQNLLELENEESNGTRESWHITHEPEWVDGDRNTKSRVTFDLDVAEAQV